jgi:hypothetical protein
MRVVTYSRSGQVKADQPACESCQGSGVAPSLTILRSIRSRDPDGWAREPNDADRARFRNWVLETYGIGTWETYLGNWEPTA